MNASTVFWTVVSGTAVFVLGQFILQFVIDPAQALRKTIASIAQARIEHAEVTSNPGLLPDERNTETARLLKKLSAELHSHFFLIRPYWLWFRVLWLPSRIQLFRASAGLNGLSNSVYRAGERTYEANAKRWEKICDDLGIYIDADERWPM